MSANRRAVGVIQVVASAVGYGLIGVFGKRAYEAGMRPGELLALRFILATALLWGYLLIARRHLISVRPRQAMACVSLGMFGYAVFSSLYFRALEGLSASLAVLLLYSSPVMVTFGARLILKERVSRAQWLSLPIVSSGLLMLLWGDLSVRNRSAIAFGIGAAIIYAAYIIASSRLVSSVNGLSAGLYIMTGTTLALNLVAPTTLGRVDDLSGPAWSSIISLALVSTVGALVLFLMGLEKLTSTEATLLSTIEPLTAVVAAALFLKEELAPLQIVGGALVLCAVILSSPTRPGRDVLRGWLRRRAREKYRQEG